jgi:branched-chain amino acid transport system substrate-binding protein
MKKKRFLLIGVLLLFGCMGISGSVWGKDVVKIGVIGPMNFTQGTGHWNGAVLAAEELNGEGGIQVGGKKMKVELIKSDSNEFLSITDATNAMERLITYDKADFIVGGFRTEAVLAMQDIAMDYKKIFLGCGAATKVICDRVGEDYNRYKYWFRITPFNNLYLAKTNFIHLATVAHILRTKLGVQKPKVAIVGEKQAWVEAMIEASKKHIPAMGMEIVGIWRPSQTATDVTAELSAIQRADADIIFTIFSASVGITFAKQAGELKIPAFMVGIMVGINVEAQKDGFWEATGGMGNYVMTMNTYARGVEYNDMTKPFVDKYIERFGETPTYTADTHAAILILAECIKRAGTLDADKIVPEIEKYDEKGTSGRIKFDKNHDPVWGPGFLTSLGVQWQDGKLVGVWPNNWVAKEGLPPITHKGIIPFKLPPWLIQKYKK